jgi:hypothetical protein
MIHAYRDENADGAMLHYQLAGWLQFAGMALLLYPGGFLKVWRRLNPAQLAIIAVFYLSVLLQIQGEGFDIAVGLIYTLVFVGTALLLPTIWNIPSDDIAKALAGAAVVLTCFQILSIALLGLPQERFVGAINPNLFGTTVLPAFILAQFGTGWLMIVVRIVSVIVAALISSRYCLFGALIAFFLFQLTFNRIRVGTIALILASACVMIFVSYKFPEILALSDAERGFDSGFTGRDQEWASALDFITNNPWGAGYKRSDITFAGHNGYLKLIVEFGVLGGVILIAAFLWIVGQAAYTAHSLSCSDPQIRRFASARAAGLVAFSAAAFFQPQLFNIGDPVGISIMLLLFGPNFAGQPVASTFYRVRPGAAGYEARQTIRSAPSGRRSS